MGITNKVHQYVTTALAKSVEHHTRVLMSPQEVSQVGNGPIALMKNNAALESI
jgi:hypothetical protein